MMINNSFRISALDLRLILIIITIYMAYSYAYSRLSYIKRASGSTFTHAALQANNNPSTSASISIPIDIPDLRQTPFVGSWNYSYRENGMQTSTDDVLVAFIACLPYYYHIPDPTTLDPPQCDPLPWLSTFRNIDSFLSTPKSENLSTQLRRCKYLDMGCGIASILLMVSQNLSPEHAIGIEAQLESYSIARHSINQIVDYEGEFHLFHEDIRMIPHKNEEFSSLFMQCDLITANPPYIPHHDHAKALAKDPQRRKARFALAGSVDDYLLVASKLLSPSGRMVMSFWSKDSNHVHDAAKLANLVIKAEIRVFMGAMTSNEKQSSPHITIFEIGRPAIRRESHGPCIVDLDLRFQPGYEATSKRYKDIRSWLGLHPKPLKKNKNDKKS